MSITYHDYAPSERAALLRNQRRSVESQIAVLEAEQMAGTEINAERLTDLEKRHGDLTKAIDSLDEDA